MQARGPYDVDMRSHMYVSGLVENTSGETEEI